MAEATVTAAQRYAALEQLREPFLKRARECATLTIPYLMPPSGFGPSSGLPTPYQSIGARGVRTLASKLLLALFPPNTPFFKYAVDDLAMREMEKQAQQDALRGEVEKALSSRERAVIQELETAIFRPVAFVALQHLIVTGNFLLYIPKEGRARGFRLDQYVVRRSPDGAMLEIVVKEQVNPASLPEATRRAVQTSDADKKGSFENVTWDLYTRVWLDEAGEKWNVIQEINGREVPDSDGTYLPEKLPWLPLRLSTQPGEHYGRAYVEEYLGDLDSLEGLVQSIVEGSAAAARIVFLVSPNGTTQLRVVSNAKNGDVVSGEAKDVGTLRADKAADLSVARQQAQDIGQSLAFAFLLNTAVQRAGERVTAEEIRYMAADLDNALGGVYTLLGAEFQLPVVRLFEDRMESRRKVPELPKNIVAPTIVTGMDAIGRGYDQRNLKLFVSEIIQAVGPEIAMKVLNLNEFMKRSAASYGIDTQGLLVDQQALADQEQQGMLMALAEKLGPEGIRQLGGMGTEVLKAQLAQPGAQGVPPEQLAAAQNAAQQ